MNQKRMSDGDGPDQFSAQEKKGLIERLFGGLIEKKWLALLAALLLAAVSVPGLFHLDITVNIEEFFLEDDPVLQNQQKFRRLFHNNDFVGVLVESEDVFSRESLELIKTVGDRLQAEVPLAKEAVSIVHVKGPFGSGIDLPFKNGRLAAGDDALIRLKAFYNASGSLKGVLFSTDNRQAWVQLALLPYPSGDSWKEPTEPLFAVGKAAYDTVRSIKTGNARLTATGVPVYAFRKEAEMMSDLSRVLGLGALMALLLTVLIFQNVQGVAGTLFIISLSVATVFGIQGSMGISMDSAFIAVPILLTMGVSIGYTVHINRFFKMHLKQSGDRKASVVHAMMKSAKPILFTAITTIVALLSFIFVEIKPIQWVGFTSALCIFFVYVFSMLFFPILLAFGGNREIIHESHRINDIFEKTLQLFGQWLVRYRTPIIILFCAVTAIALWGVFKLKVDFNAEKMMGTRLPHMKDQVRIGKSEIATNDAMDLVLTFPAGSLSDPEYIKRIERLEKEIGGLPLVKKTSSLAGVVRNLNSLIHQHDAAFATIPTGKDALRGLLDASKGSDPDYLKSWVTDNYSTTRIFIELTDFSSLKIERSIKKIETLVADLFPPGTESFFSGSTYQMAVMNQYITRGLIRSVMTAFGLITILMIIVFKSIRVGIIAMIPNIFPVLIAGGIMGYCNIPMEFVTMTVAPMIMGLAVDDTIHLLSHLKNEMEHSGNFTLSVTRTFSVVGSAITETSLILCVSFLVLTFSKVNSINNMGIIACAGIFAAYIADIFVTPIILEKMKYSS